MGRTFEEFFFCLLINIGAIISDSMNTFSLLILRLIIVVVSIELLLKWQRKQEVPNRSHLRVEAGVKIIEHFQLELALPQRLNGFKSETGEGHRAKDCWK
jgi:hypothetical protein